MTGSKSAKSDGGSAKSAKSEWEGVGDWSKSAKSDGGSAKSAKSEWEGVDGSAKSAKSEWEGVGKSSKSESISPPLGTGDIEFCDDMSQDACYQEAITCPAEEPPECNGLEFIGAYCIPEETFSGKGPGRELWEAEAACDDLSIYPTNCSYYGYGGYKRKLAEGERKLEKWNGKYHILMRHTRPAISLLTVSFSHTN